MDTTLDQKEVASRYERLRAQFLAGDYVWKAACGLGVVLRTGLLAWVEQVNDSSVHADPEAINGTIGAAHPELELKHRQLGAVIAQMILPSEREIAG